MSHGNKGSSALCGVLRPLHHVADDVRKLSVATLRYSSYDDPVPTLDPAKLPYCYSNVIGAAFSTLSSPAAPAPLSLLFVAWSVCLVLLLFRRPEPFCGHGRTVTSPTIVLSSRAPTQVRTNGA